MMSVDQQIAEIRAWLDAAIEHKAGIARSDIAVLALKARRAIGKMLHFQARSAGQKKRWAKIKSQEGV